VGFNGGADIIIDPANLDTHLQPGAGIIYLGSVTAGNITIGDANFDNKNIGFITGADINDRIGGVHLITANILGLNAAGSIGNNQPVHTEVNVIRSVSGGQTVIREGDDVFLDTVVTANGYVDIISGGRMTVNTVTAGGAGSNVWLSTLNWGQDIVILGNITALDDIVYLDTSGNITDPTDSATRIRAGTLEIVNAQTVGSYVPNGRLDTEVGWYNDHRIYSGDAYFYQVGDVILRDVEVQKGRLDLFCTGSIYGSSRFPAEAIEGRLGITLTALGRIGTPYDPLWVDAPYGTVIVAAYGEIDRVSANLRTETPFGNNHEPYDLFQVANYTPGLVLYNNRLMGGAPISDVKNRGFYVLDASYNVDMLYPYYYRWVNNWGYNIFAQKIAAITDLVTDLRPFGENVLLSPEELGYELSLDKAGKIIMLKDGRKQLDLGVFYPRPRFMNPPFWMYDQLR
jgi:hypothetical protein